MFDHNTGLRPLLLEEGNGRVLVIDNGGSARTAVMGEKLANLALKNGKQATTALFFHQIVF